jgi:hypothetical protein
MSPKNRGLRSFRGYRGPKLRFVVCADRCQGGNSDAIEPTEEEMGSGPWYEDSFLDQRKQIMISRRVRREDGSCSARKSGYWRDDDGSAVRPVNVATRIGAGANRPMRDLELGPTKKTTGD